MVATSLPAIYLLLKQSEPGYADLLPPIQRILEVE